MDPLILVLIVLLLVVVGLLALLLRQKKDPSSSSEALPLIHQQIEGLRNQTSTTLQEQTRAVNEQLNQITAQVNQRLQNISQQVTDSQKNVGDRLDNAARVVGEVQKGLGALSQASERIFDVGKNISELQNILKAPKLRGGLGEYFLGELLAQILPSRHFQTQYAFKSGATVDAVIQLGERKVPVDSKFPLENFKKLQEVPTEEKKAAQRKFTTDVKKHVDAIADKYILPEEGTYDFALMYIPAENVYYEIIVRDETANGDFSILDYALKRRVIPVSPNSFYAYLQAILLGFKGMQVEDNARLIMENLSQLQLDLERFKEGFDLVGKHLSNAQSKYNDMDRFLQRYQERLVSLVNQPKEEKSLPKDPSALP